MHRGTPGARGWLLRHPASSGALSSTVWLWPAFLLNVSLGYATGLSTRGGCPCGSLRGRHAPLTSSYRQQPRTCLRHGAPRPSHPIVRCLGQAGTALRGARGAETRGCAVRRVAVRGYEVRRGATRGCAMMQGAVRGCAVMRGAARGCEVRRCAEP